MTNATGFQQLLALEGFKSVMDKKPTSWDRTSTGITFTIGMDCWVKDVSKDGDSWATLCIVDGDKIAFVTLAAAEYQGEVDTTAKSYSIIKLTCLVANGKSSVGDIVYRAIAA